MKQQLLIMNTTKVNVFRRQPETGWKLIIRAGNVVKSTTHGAFVHDPTPELSRDNKEWFAFSSPSCKIEPVNTELVH